MLTSMEPLAEAHGGAAIVVRHVAQRSRLNQGEAHNPAAGEGWEIWLRTRDGRLDYLGFEATLAAALAPYEGGPLPVLLDEPEPPR